MVRSGTTIAHACAQVISYANKQYHAYLPAKAGADHAEQLAHESAQVDKNASNQKCLKRMDHDGHWNPQTADEANEQMLLIVHLGTPIASYLRSTVSQK
jgi:hypothetical protein